MIISFGGPGNLKIQTGGTTILTEGLNGEVSGRMKPDIFIRTRESSVLSQPKDKTPNAENIIHGPGEYEIKDIEITGLPDFVYLIKAEEIQLGLFGGKDVDILFAPDTADGVKAIQQLHPKIVISSAGSCKELEKGLGKKAEGLDKLVIKKKEIPTTPLSRIICLKV